MKVKIYSLYVPFCEGDFLGKVQKVFKKEFLGVKVLNALQLCHIVQYFM